MVKSTYGTGCFALLNTGAKPVASRNRLLTTIAYQLDGKRTYALEGAIFVAGAAVQWLRDGLKIIAQAADVNALAAKADPAERVYLVPAFVGPAARSYWDAEARRRCSGWTRNSGAAEIARAALESVGYQTRELLEAMRADWPEAADTVLRVDGGMTASDPTMQFLADILGAPVERPGGDGNDRARRRCLSQPGSRRRFVSPRSRGALPRPGGSTGASNRRSMPRPATPNGRAGATPWHAPARHD